MVESSEEEGEAAYGLIKEHSYIKNIRVNKKGIYIISAKVSVEVPRIS